MRGLVAGGFEELETWVDSDWKDERARVAGTAGTQFWIPVSTTPTAIPNKQTEAKNQKKGNKKAKGKRQDLCDFKHATILDGARPLDRLRWEKDGDFLI